MNNVFTNANVGDPVAIRKRTGTGPGLYLRGIVKRVTATQVIVTSETGSEWRFKRADGYEIGVTSRYSGTWAKPWTAEVDAEVAHAAERKVVAERREKLAVRLRSVAHKVGSSAEVDANAAMVDRFEALVAAAEAALAQAVAS